MSWLILFVFYSLLYNFSYPGLSTGEESRGGGPAGGSRAGEDQNRRRSLLSVRVL